jgi:hypothetical protein
VWFKIQGRRLFWPIVPYLFNHSRGQRLLTITKPEELLKSQLRTLFVIFFFYYLLLQPFFLLAAHTMTNSYSSYTNELDSLIFDNIIDPQHSPMDVESNLALWVSPLFYTFFFYFAHIFHVSNNFYISLG